MRKNSCSIRRAILSALVLTVLMTVAPAAHAQKGPFEQDPGGGGSSGNLCWTQSCAACGEQCHPIFPDICWAACFYSAANGACACWFQNGVCSGNGACTYVP